MVNETKQQPVTRKLNKITSLKDFLFLQRKLNNKLNLFIVIWLFTRDVNKSNAMTVSRETKTMFFL